ncbi:MAG: hypothetical protein ACYCWW_08290 [Deltaproteobacteria bacterium]
MGALLKWLAAAVIFCLPGGSFVLLALAARAAVKERGWSALRLPGGAPLFRRRTSQS